MERQTGNDRTLVVKRFTWLLKEKRKITRFFDTTSESTR